LDLSIFGYQFMQNAILSAFLGGIACATIGVFVVLMHMPFIGVAMAHAAFAGALLGLWLGFNPLIGALALSLAAAAIIALLNSLLVLIVIEILKISSPRGKTAKEGQRIWGFCLAPGVSSQKVYLVPEGRAPPCNYRDCNVERREVASTVSLMC